MKAFQFHLEPVLNYKQQALDLLLTEHRALLDRVEHQTRVRDTAAEQLADFDSAYTQKKSKGLTAVEALECQGCIQVLEQQVRQETQQLKTLQQMAEAKRLQILEARKGTFSLERLKEKKEKKYSDSLRKAEETFLDDLTAARRVTSST
ncbi:MAG: flagellar export protein FliJ [Lawsonibacter sp.]